MEFSPHPEVVVVGFFKLIFDDDLSAVRVFAIQVEAKWSN